MAGKGGARPGAGRKPKAEEAETRVIATNAIISKFGSKEAAFEWLMGSGEPALVKFAFEHAFGKPVDQVQHSGEITQHGVVLSDSQLDKLISKINEAANAG